MAPKKLKFGFHDFINAQPLLIPFKEKERELGITLVTASPAELAERLQAGKLDMAMIPSIEYLKNTGQYQLIPGLSVSSRGPVGTVLLVSRLPLREVKSVALDARSRTSTALLQVLFGEVFPRNVSLKTAKPDPKAMLKKHDAALIIGDLAFQLRSDYPDLDIYDLSEQWFEQTGKMFVHAVVAVRKGVKLKKKFLLSVQDVKEEGRSRLESIARTESEKLGIDYETCLDYLSNKILYDLGKEELIGLQHFRDVCFKKGILNQKGIIKYVPFEGS